MRRPLCTRCALLVRACTALLLLHGCDPRYDHDSPESIPIPEFHERLDSFERMLVVRAMREDRTLLSVQDYIISTLGKRYMDSRPLDLKAVCEEATARVPTIALLSMGADPTGPIVDLAKKRKKAVLSISMGQGQEPAARKLLNQGVTTGDWVLLQNCHLGLGFLIEVRSSVHGQHLQSLACPLATP